MIQVLAELLLLDQFGPTSGSVSGEPESVAGASVPKTVAGASDPHSSSTVDSVSVSSLSGGPRRIAALLVPASSIPSHLLDVYLPAPGPVDGVTKSLHDTHLALCSIADWVVWPVMAGDAIPPQEVSSDWDFSATERLWRNPWRGAQTIVDSPECIVSKGAPPIHCWAG